MANPSYRDYRSCVIYCVDDPVIAGSNSPRIRHACELFATRRPRLIRQTPNSTHYPFEISSLEIPQLSQYFWLKLYLVSHDLSIPTFSPKYRSRSDWTLGPPGGRRPLCPLSRHPTQRPVADPARTGAGRRETIGCLLSRRTVPLLFVRTCREISRRLAIELTRYQVGQGPTAPGRTCRTAPAFNRWADALAAMPARRSARLLRAGFGEASRPMEAGGRPALIMVDMTRGFVDWAYPTGWISSRGAGPRCFQGLKTL